MTQGAWHGAIWDEKDVQTMDFTLKMENLLTSTLPKGVPKMQDLLRSLCRSQNHPNFELCKGKSGWIFQLY